VGAVNEQPERMAADYAAQVFQDGFLANEEAYSMGLPRVPLVQLYDAAERVITAAGGKVLLGTSAEALEFDAEHNRVTALLVEDGGRIEADAIISAVPFDRLAKLCPAPLIGADPRLAKLNDFEVSPIIGIHLWFAARGTPATRGGQSASSAPPVMTLPHLILTQSPVHWIFNKGFDPEVGGSHLHAVISAAHGLVNQPAQALVDMAAAEVRRFIPGTNAPGVELIHAQAVKEKRATFSAAPGVDALRPPAASLDKGVRSLYLAGDWCRTGWPATMEGATRSGYLAAAAVLGDFNSAVAPLPAADLEPGLLFRALSR
jgi:zeta-carotene desaturase